ncbi:FecR family protein [Mangrovimonas sp. YM274]|uniref:FecR family protein n=1 Tax=Mangrovimonas sp. YM274 TaxID=3070660 RepID=UPI0027DE8130|nr:FecR domain-containing protein [Mangrovimonas sp. YM274]WMI68156.1 FecR domain-containing protein [Mangrovimonas sp. YM274]
MNEKEFKHIVTKYLKGKASQKEIEILKHFEDEMNKPERRLPRLENSVKVERRIYANIKGSLFGEKRLWLKIAATLVIMLGLSGFLFWPSNDQVHTIANYSDKVEQVVLVDGSKVMLNIGSEISYNEDEFNETIREIELKGEAFFDVTRNESKPFIVNSGDVATKVLGTSFNIDYSGNNTVVTVVSGKVGVLNGKTNETVVLHPNEQTISNASGYLTKLKTNAKLFTSWYQNQVYLDQITIHQFLNFISSEYGVKILEFDSRFGEEHISIVVNNKEPIDVLLKRFNFISNVQLIKTEQDEIALTVAP